MAALSKEKIEEIQRRNAPRIYGCSFDEAVLLNDGSPLRTYRSAANKYCIQRQMAKRREIPWEFTFPAWLQMWKESGKWEWRGIKKDQYCMARRGDVGHYSVGNVRIVTNRENCQENLAVLEPKHRAVGVGLGAGRGWSIAKNCNVRPYSVECANKYIGNFATQVEAEAAYRKACNEHLAARPAKNP